MKPLESATILLIGLVIGLFDCADVVAQSSSIVGDGAEGSYYGLEPDHQFSGTQNQMLKHALHEIEKRLKESPDSLEYRNISHFTQLSRDPNENSQYYIAHFSVWANFARKHCIQVLFNENRCKKYECTYEPIANSKHEIEILQSNDRSGTLVKFIPVYDDADSYNNPRPEESHPNDREYSILNKVLAEISTRLGERYVLFRNISHFSQLSQNTNVEEGGQRFLLWADFERKKIFGYGNGYDVLCKTKGNTGMGIMYEPIESSQHEIEVQQYSNGRVALLKFIRSNHDSFNDHTTNNPTHDPSDHSTINPNIHPTNDPLDHPTPEELSMLAEVLHCIQHRLKWNRSVRYHNISHFKQLPEDRQTGRHFSVVANFERPATCKLDRVPNCVYEPMPNSEYYVEVQQNTTLRGDNEYIPMGTNIRSLELRK